MEHQVGFIGLGIMGRPMALNLARAGVKLLVYDVNPAALTPLVEIGAQAAGSVKEIGAGCGLIFFSLPNGQVVEQTLFGGDGLAGSLQPGTLICDMSSITMEQAVRFAQRLHREAECEYMDSPVSGGEQSAIKGTLSIMAGCTPEQFERMRPYYEIIGSSCHRMGDVGMGCVAKLCNQIIVTSNITAICEAAAFAEKFGVSLDVLFDALRCGSANSAMMENRSDKLFRRDFTPGATINIHWKDMRNVLCAAEEAGVEEMPVSRVLERILAEHSGAGSGLLDSSSLLLYYERLFGVHMPPQG